MVEEIRLKWCEDLEDMLQCPVCYERPQGDILLCDKGHHVCFQCKSQMSLCPMCQKPFSGTRSYLAEELASKLTDIKTSLVDPMHPINRVVNRNKAVASVQTDPLPQAEQNSSNVNNATSRNSASSSSSSLFSQNSRNNEEIELPMPKVGKGKYPCCIGNCDMELPHGRMLQHIRFYHQHNLYETSSQSSIKYKQSWVLKYTPNTVCDVALHINKMGIFFLKISLNCYGDLTGYLQIVNSSFQSRHFSCDIEITDGRRTSSYHDAPVFTCRTTEDRLLRNSLQISHIDMRRLSANRAEFTCILVIHRQPVLPENGDDPLGMDDSNLDWSNVHSDMHNVLKALRNFTFIK